MFDREGDEKYRFIETVTFLQGVALDSIILRWKSDFQEVNAILLKSAGTSRYLMKYITKTSEKIVYSSGIAEVIYKELGESDIVGTYLDFVTKYVLWDDVIDWERDIMSYGKRQRLCI